MARLIGFMANRTDLLADVLDQEAASTRPPSEADAWGMGFYQGGEVLHKKRPLREGERPDWAKLVRGVRTDCALLHVRRATVGGFRVENTHPFRMRRWLFAHNGTIPGFERLQDRFLDAMPDFVRRNVRGETDSEHFFHVLLAMLHDVGQLDALDPDVEAVLSALRATVSTVDRWVGEIGEQPASLDAMLTNGRLLVALRRGAPMGWVARAEPPTASSRLGPPPAVAEGTSARYVLVVGDGEGLPSEYESLEEGAVLVVGRDLRTAVHPL